MASSVVSQHLQDRQESSPRVLHLSFWGVATAILIVPGVLRLFLAPSIPLSALSIAAAALLWHSVRWCTTRVKHIVVTRELPFEVMQGATIPVKLSVSFQGSGSMTGLVLSDEFTLGRTFGHAGYEHATFLLHTLQAHRPIRCAYRGMCSTGRGFRRLDRIFLTIEDPLGLVSLSERRDSISEILVLPPIHRFANPGIQNPACRSGTDSHGVQEVGIGDEFAGTREFRPGDRVRDIHWRSSAKTGVIVVREHHLRVKPDLVVLIHLFRSPPWSRLTPPSPLESGAPEFGTGSGAGILGRRASVSKRALDLCVEAASSVASWGHEAGYSTTFIGAGLEPFVLGRFQNGESVQHVLRHLAVIQPQSTRSLSSVFAPMKSHIPPGAVVVLVAPTASLADPSALAAILMIQRGGAALKLILTHGGFDPRCFTAWNERFSQLGIETWIVGSIGELREALSQETRMARA